MALQCLSLEGYQILFTLHLSENSQCYMIKDLSFPTL